MMANFGFRLLLTFNATSLLVIIYLVQNSHTLGDLFPTVCWFYSLPNMVSYLLYAVAPVLSTGLSILLSAGLGKDDFRDGQVVTIEHANNSFLPSYLGYFFVALSIGNWETLGFVYGILFVFTFLSQALYFNPLFLLFGFDFYNITTKSGTAIFLISRNKFKRPTDVDIPIAHRINDYTYIQRS